MNNNKLPKIALAITLSLASMTSTQAIASNPSTAKEKLASWDKHQLMQEASEFSSLKWRSVGPVEQGGRVIDIESPQGMPYTWYVAYASGGLWKTTNNGSTFKPLFDEQSTMIMGDVAIDPNNPQTIWVGTGEDNSSRSSYGGLGMYRSIDGGKTWEHKGLSGSDRIGRIAIDPRNSNRIFVATLGKLYTKGGQRGIYLTEDGGDTWEQILAGGKETGFIDLQMDPNNPDIIFASSWEFDRKAWNFNGSGADSGIWRTTNGGKKWSKLNNGFPEGDHVGRIGLSISASNSKTVYASMDNQALMNDSEMDASNHLTVKLAKNISNSTLFRYEESRIKSFIKRNKLNKDVDVDLLIEQLKDEKILIKDLAAKLIKSDPDLLKNPVKGIEIYRSNDSGNSWHKTHDKPISGVVNSYGYYFGQIRVAPDNSDKLYVLGVPLISSDDGGKNWYGINGKGVHSDHQSLWIDPANPARIINGNDGGVDVSHDRGTTWQRVDKQAVGQFYTVAVDMEKPYNVFGGLQDNGTYMGSSKNYWDNRRPWKRLGGGDGMYVNVDTRDNKTRYVGSQYGYYGRTDADGEYTSITPQEKDGEEDYRFNWNTPVRLSSHNQDIVYIGSQYLHRSMDQGNNWEKISPDLTTNKNDGNVSHSTITTISESTKQFGLVWVGTDDGNIQVTQNGGLDWKRVSKKLPKKRWVTRVEASKFAKNRAYVSLNGYRNDDTTAYIYRTDNLGKKWKNIGKNLPAEAVNVIKEDPVNENVVYVGTDRGVYVSHDRGDHWQSLSAGLPNVAVHDLLVHPRENELVIGTHGRSIWILDALPLQKLTPELRKKPLHVFKVADAAAPSRRKPSQWYHRPEYTPKKTFTYWSDKSTNVTLTIADKEGNKLRTITTKAEKGMNSIDWDLMADKELALSAENKVNADKDFSAISYAKIPYTQAVANDKPLYVSKGEYKLTLDNGNENIETNFKLTGR